MPQATSGREDAPIANDPSARVRELNDKFRRTFVGGIIAATTGFDALDFALRLRFITTIQTFEDFEAGNDPYAGHDFGSVTIDDTTAFWKIDYYDCAMIEGSPDPADPLKTLRVMTIMLASEY